MGRSKSWMSVAFDSWALGLDASAVIGLRMAKLAAGGAAGASEMQLMVQEKVDAAIALQALALTGKLGASPHGATSKTLKHYRAKVRANRRRLGSSRSR